MAVAVLLGSALTTNATTEWPTGPGTSPTNPMLPNWPTHSDDDQRMPHPPIIGFCSGLSQYTFDAAERMGMSMKCLLNNH